MCSAVSFGCSTSSRAQLQVLFVCRPTRSRARYRARGDDTVAQPHHRLGRRSDDGARIASHEVQVRARVHLTQHPVDVERVRVEVHVETLRKDHLEDVPGDDVLLGDEHSLLVGFRGHRAPDLRPGLAAGRHRQGRLGERLEQVCRELVEPDTGTVVCGIQLGSARSRAERHVVHEHNTLEPVVEGAQLAYQEQRRIGQTEIVVRHIGEMLDLAHHVVTEIPDETAV